MSSATVSRKVLDEARNKRNRSVFLRDIIVIRLINAWWIATFFQPDEFFQSLEPAWDLAFGSRSGAWLTWVCLFLSSVYICLSYKHSCVFSPFNMWLFYQLRGGKTPLTPYQLLHHTFTVNYSHLQNSLGMETSTQNLSPPCCLCRGLSHRRLYLQPHPPYRHPPRCHPRRSPESPSGRDCWSW